MVLRKKTFDQHYQNQHHNYSPKQTKASISHLHLTSNGFFVRIVDSAKYLEIVIDNKLNFK